MGMSDGNVRFACRRCGKCCNTAPTVSIGEAFALADVFLAGIEIRFGMVPGAPPGRRLDELGAGDEGGIPVYVSVAGFALNWLEQCPARQGNDCSLYDRRPVVCRLLPFDLHATPDTVGTALRLSPEDAAAHGLDCDFGDQAPTIATPDGIIDPGLREAYQAGRAALERDLAVLPVLGREVIVSAWLARKKGGAPVFSSLLPLVRQAVATGSLGREEGRNLLSRQIALADVFMSAADGRTDAAWRIEQASAFAAEYRTALAREVLARELDDAAGAQSISLL